MVEFKEYVEEIIADQYANLSKKTEEELQPISLHIKDIVSKESNQDNKLLTYENHLENMIKKQQNQHQD